MDSRRSLAVQGGCCLITFALGSIHAFSVLIGPLEQSLQVARGGVSLVYSSALVSLTVAVLFGWRIYHRMQPAALILFACAMAGVGLLVAAAGESYPGLLIGYGLIFGAANGLGYGFVLQLCARGTATDAGRAMALVTACYALGAMGFSWVLTGWVADAGMAGALTRQALTVIGAGLLGALMVGFSGVRFGAAHRPGRAATHQVSGVAVFWWAYGCNVFAGLMVIGHAAGIVIAAGGQTGLAALGAVLVGFGNALGGLAAGFWSRRFPPKRSLVLMPALTASSLALMLLVAGPWVALVGLATAGFAYGASIAIYPHAIHEVYGEDGPRIYGRVFTAWGTAGLVAPWLAGGLFQLGGDYRLPMASAVVFAVISVVWVRTLPFSAASPA